MPNRSARGWSLMPRAPASSARARLGERAVVRVDAAVGDQAVRMGRGGGDHRVVGRRVAVGLVHREHDAPCVRGLQRFDELFRLLLEPVRVVAADVGVRVVEVQRPRVLRRSGPATGGGGRRSRSRLARHPTAGRAMPDTGGMHHPPRPRAHRDRPPHHRGHAAAAGRGLPVAHDRLPQLRTTPTSSPSRTPSSPGSTAAARERARVPRGLGPPHRARRRARVARHVRRVGRAARRAAAR